MSMSKKDRTAAIQKSLETRERTPIAHLDSREYIQHNVTLGDGIAPLLAFMDALPADGTRVNVTHRFEDGDHSFALAEYELGDWGPMVGFEVHRWRDDRIVEHWDNLQATPTTANPSGRRMTDGATMVADLDRTEANETLAGAFVRDVLVSRSKAPAELASATLVQHHPRFGDGSAALGSWLDAGADRYERLRKLLGEGNFVLAISEGTSLDDEGARRPAAFHDLFRIADGVVAEQWNVTEVIAPREDWANGNGKF